MIDLSQPPNEPIRWTFRYKPSSEWRGNVRVHVTNKSWHAARMQACARLGCTVEQLIDEPTEGNPYVL